MWRTRALPWFVLAILPAIVGLVALHGIARSVAELAGLLVFLGAAVRCLVLAVRDDPVRANGRSQPCRRRRLRRLDRRGVRPGAAPPRSGGQAQGRGGRDPGKRASARRRRSITPIM